MIAKVFSKAGTAAAALFAALLLTSCFETKQEFTLNPDGSGKVVHQSKFQAINLNPGSRPPEAEMRSAVADLLKEAKGVDAWSDVSYEMLADGRISFKGTAYFKRLADLDIPNQTFLDFTWETDADGRGVLAIKQPDQAEGDAKVPADPLAERAKFQQSKAMLGAVMGTMKHSVTFDLPGEPAEVSNFSRDGRAVSLHLEGTKLLAALETLMADDDWIARHGFDNESPPPFDNRFNELLFGENAPVRAVVKLAQAPAFDYAAEVAAATAAFGETREKLGLGATAVGPAAGGEPLESLTVAGVQLATEVGDDFNFRPFHTEPGYALSLLAEFPGAVHAISRDSMVETATASDGSDLLLDSRFAKQIQNPRLSDNKTAALFEVKLKSPGPGVTGINEVSGTLKYSVSAGTGETDLGFTAIKAGQSGTQFDAKIDSIEDGDGSHILNLEIGLKPDDIVAVTLRHGETSIELDRRGYSGFNNSYTYRYESKQPFPEDAEIIVETHQDVSEFEVPFSIRNITLLGRPAGE